MAKLNWTEHDDAWHSGPYRIELLAPRQWVLSEPSLSWARTPVELAKISATSGSLRALMTEVEAIERRRRMRQRLSAWMLVGAICMVAIFAASASDSSYALVVVVLASGLGVLALINSIDCVVSRSWENLSETYQ